MVQRDAKYCRICPETGQLDTEEDKPPLREKPETKLLDCKRFVSRMTGHHRYPPEQELSSTRSRFVGRWTPGVNGWTCETSHSPRHQTYKEVKHAALRQVLVASDLAMREIGRQVTSLA
ncbi:hypothetical protein C0Q70_07175 [Pomacea canaliculata]|uniref:Uncharacterized protein n=1 Tax=Pomacea canaliculata TaxID=400727 RepID=A0A2T7PEC6_POMCA|nr:hypothetical protein C0Q70_07175 [Pomacea canaliculata]